jgi:Zn-finger protein
MAFYSIYYYFYKGVKSVIGIYIKQRRKGVKSCLKSKVLHGKKKEKKFKIKIKVESQNKKKF